MRETIVTSGSVATAYVSAFFVGEERPAVRLGMVTDLTFDDKDNPEFDIAIGNYGGHWQLAQRAGKHNLRETSIQTPEETRRILALGGLVVAHFLDNPQQTLLAHLSSRQAVAMQSFNTAQLQALEQTHYTQLIPGSATLPQ